MIGGHQRLIAARRLGHTDVPVVFLDIGADEARTLNLALNHIGGEWDDELLARLLADLEESPLDATLSGFDSDEIGAILRTLDAREKRERLETFDLQDALDHAHEKETRVQPGDLWQLGDHRLCCGDATDPDDVARLLGGTPAAMCFTDPPYGVAYGDHGGQPRDQPKRRIANDALSPDDWQAFCSQWTQTLVGAVSGALYVCMSTKEWPTVSALLTAAGAHWSDTVIWAKDRHVLGRAPYQRAYEPIWFGWPESATPFWCGDRDQTDVWTIARAAVNDLHPTQKPLALVERAIRNSSQTGDTVLDLFAGAGTTLIAAERAGRTCRALELDPHYCDIVLARWEAFTGETARKDDPRG